MAFTSIAASGAAKTLMAVTISMHPHAAAHNTGHITVKPGQTLSSISQQAYGSSADWPALWWTNRHTVHNPQVLQVGQRLRIKDKPALTAAIRHAAQGAIPVAAPAPVHEAAPAAAPEQATAAPAESSAPATTAYTGSGGFQSCVIQAESGGDASAVNASTGAGGLYGFLPSTWAALGYSGSPQNASVAEQNAAFAKEYAQGGAGAWAPYDGC
jgi:resuscitation-promoting factor RpfC